ncbi:14940_t:CDS:2 [Dentiscutata heterogama]|uniref:14940_t:CDS:1 n=1 Tax=Dentiscutata heterogama TaxID=1316150 RepID=A0ACA9K0G2_9GLOM|nr:14940_t:CDS:2 [Dentiscutata heterogama]
MDLNDSYCNNSPESQDLLQDMSDNNIASSSTGITSFSLVARNRKPSIVTPYFTKKTKNDVNSPVIWWSTIELFALTQNNAVLVQTLTIDQKAQSNILLAE